MTDARILTSLSADLNNGKTRTPLLAFRGQTPFSLRQHNMSPNANQKGKAGEVCFTSLDQFSRSVLLQHPQQFHLLAKHVSLPCIPPEAWNSTDFSGKKILILLPSQALGSNVATLLFIAALRERWNLKKVGVFCAGSATDIYLIDPQVKTYPLWLGESELAEYDALLDLGHLEARQDIDIWPVDMEGDLLAAFNLPPSRRYGSDARPMRVIGKPSVGFFPLATSPIRTLPPAAMIAAANAIRDIGHITFSLNKHQHQGVLYKAALAGQIPGGVKILDGFDSIGPLLQAIRKFDYIICADSGPAHMSKLFGTPGVAIYSSAPGDILQGRFSNLARWTVPYQGAHCQSPCGLAKLRQSRDGRIGCMGSLGLTLEDLPDTPKGARLDEVERLMNDEPVPCIAQLRDQPEALAEFIRADLTRRLVQVNR